jgi:hypothetical protein
MAIEVPLENPGEEPTPVREKWPKAWLLEDQAEDYLLDGLIRAVERHIAERVARGEGQPSP